MKNMLDLAARIAQSGETGRNFKLGCVARRRDGALVTATNEKTQVPNPHAHAEARVLRKAGKGATLWVARITKNGSLTMARPCPRCQAKIRSYEVKKVIYSISNEEYGIWYPMRDKQPTQDVEVDYDCNHAIWRIK